MAFARRDALRRLACLLARQAAADYVAGMDAVATLAAATEPGRRLVFGDDTGVGHAPGMMPDVEVMAAVDMRSEDYAVVAATIAAFLAEHGLSEFHATDVAGGRRGTAWAAAGMAVRLEAFRVMRDALTDGAATLLYAHVSRRQYEGMRRELQDMGIPLNLGWKAALTRAFLRSLIDEAASGPRPTLIVVDQDRPLPEPVVDRSERAPFLVGGGVIRARSSDAPGLQMADMAAYCMGRHLRRRGRHKIGEADAFDEIAAETVAGFAGRVRHLLA